jgi:D-alanyl-D-alanine carboxypeptidase
VHHRFASTIARVLLLASAIALPASAAQAEALLLVDAQTGKVLRSENAAHQWYPASLSKLMTTYVTLKAVKDGRIRLDNLVTVSAHALAQSPSKMGFPVGTRMTVDNALKMLLVHSANDMAVVLAEGVDGSVDKFADEMNQASARLGMTQSHWHNPNGLPDELQVTSARDLAILARALMHDFPEYDFYWHIPAIKFGKRVMRNYNKLIDRYPGADGMKTGFTCASGYNLIASATRNGRRLIAIVLGATSGRARNETAAKMLEGGFNGGNALGWLMPSLGTVEGLQPVAGSPPDLHDRICGGHRHGSEDDDTPVTGPANLVEGAANAYASIFSGANLLSSGDKQGSLLGPLSPSEPVVVTVMAPPGAPQDPDALLGGGRKRRVIVHRHKGRKAAVINVATHSGKEKEKPTAQRAEKEPSAKPQAVRRTPAAHPRKPAAAKPKPAKGARATPVPAHRTAASQ